MWNRHTRKLRLFTHALFLFLSAQTARPAVVVISENGNAGISDFLTNNFSGVTIRRGNFANFNAPATQAALVGADLVIIGRTVTSSEYDQYDSSGFNHLTIPVLCLTSYVARETANRMGWHAGSAQDSQSTIGNETTITAAGAPVFGPASTVDWHDLGGVGGDTFNGSGGPGSVGTGDILATIGAANHILVAQWDVGDAPGNPAVASGPAANASFVFPGKRLLFNLDNDILTGNARDLNTLTPAGQAALVASLVSLGLSNVPERSLVTVDANAVLRTIDDRLFGINTSVYDPDIGTAANTTLLSPLALTTLRFPGGSLSDEYDWHRGRNIGANFDWITSFPDFALLAKQHGATPYITVNYGRGTPEQAAAWVAYANGSPTNTLAIGIDGKGRNWLTVGSWATMRASSPLPANDGYNFLRINRPEPFNFTYWEVGNESYGSWEADDHGVAGTGLNGARHDPLTYAQYFKLFHNAMKAVDPSVRLGAPAVPDETSYGNGMNAVPNPNQGGALRSGWTPVMLANTKNLGAVPDFLVHHYYPQQPGAEKDAALLSSSGGLIADAMAFRQRLTDYVGGPAAAAVELAITEINSVTFNPGKQTTSLVNGLYLADAVATMSRTEIVASHWWALRNSTEAGNNNSASLYGQRNYGDYGIVAGDNAGGTSRNTPYPTYYGIKLLKHWGRGGDAVLDSTSTNIKLTVHASRMRSGKLALLLINKDPVKDLTAALTITNYMPGTTFAGLWQYGKPQDLAEADLVFSTITNAAPVMEIVLPSYSMSVLTFERPYTDLEAWRYTHFATTNDTGQAANTEDPDFDGATNIQEYYFGSDPNLLASTPAISIDGAQLTYSRRATGNPEVFTVQSSSNLTTWITVPGISTPVSSMGNRVILEHPITPLFSLPRYYFRVAVVPAPTP